MQAEPRRCPPACEGAAVRPRRSAPSPVTLPCVSSAPRRLRGGSARSSAPAAGAPGLLAAAAGRATRRSYPGCPERREAAGEAGCWERAGTNLRVSSAWRFCSQPAVPCACPQLSGQRSPRVPLLMRIIALHTSTTPSVLGSQLTLHVGLILASSNYRRCHLHLLV